MVKIRTRRSVKDTDNQKFFMKSNRVVVLDENLVRLSPPPENTRPGKLIKIFKENLKDKDYENNNEVKSLA